MHCFKHTLLAALGALSIAAHAVHAADTPAAAPVARPAAAPVASVSERLASARQAIEQKDWDRALSQLNLAAREQPRNADVHNLLGYSHRKRATPDLGKAFEHYQTALRRDPSHKGAHEYIGEAYLMDRRPAEAEKHLSQLEAICGNKTCEEYADLAQAIASYRAKNP